VAGSPALVLVHGVGLDAPGVTVFARYQGRYLQLSPVHAEQEGENQEEGVKEEQGGNKDLQGKRQGKGTESRKGNEGEQQEQAQGREGEQEGEERLATIQLQLPALPAPGLVQFELEQQLLISEPLPLLAQPSLAMANELLALEAAVGPERLRKVCCLGALLLGRVLWVHRWQPGRSTATACCLMCCIGPTRRAE
jgi:hypothetical protein